MILYHGSNVVIDEIDLLQCKPYKDFGKGFYLTDIVVGPVANDTVAFQLRRYLLGVISLEDLVKELKFKGLNRQYFFGTELAISKLRKL